MTYDERELADERHEGFCQGFLFGALATLALTALALAILL